jgi:hypothetical protein
MKLLGLAAIAATVLWAAACSPGHTTIPPPPPAGNFTAASLSGTYAFVTSGEVTTSSSASTPLTRTGSFVADGHGNITGGVYDVVNAGGLGTTPTQPNPITGGSYTVNADGRGTLTLNVNSGGSPGSINFGFVLTTGSSGTSAASSGLMIDETSNSSQASTGSGNFVLQNSSQFGISSISGPYVFDFTGLDGSSTPSPESLVGQFNATSSGAISSAIEDSNDGGALNSGSIVAGPFAADAANMTTSGRGTVIVAGQTYVFYIVDSTRVRFISSNASGAGPMLTGDAVSQSSGLPAGPSSINASFAFLVAGSSGNGGLTRVGRFTVTNGTLNKILMDVNDNFSENELTNLSNGSVGTFDPATGRGTLSFANGATSAFSFVFYLSSPTNGVIQEVSGPAGTNTAVVVDDGSVAAQSGSPFTSSNISGNYAINWSGLVFSGASGGFADEEDLVSLVKVSNLALTGTSDYFQFTSTTLTPNINAGTGGQVTLNTDGTANNSLAVSLSNASAIHMVVYIVSPQLAFFENSDNSGTQRIVVGILQAQQ